MSSPGTMDSSVFEGLFVRALKPTGAFLEDLKRVGVDPARLEPKYPEATFRAALDLACRHAYPELAQEAAWHRLGADVIAGYFTTILGRIAAGLVPAVGVEGSLKRLQFLWSAPQPAMRIQAERTGERDWKVTFENAHLPADFVAGVLEAGLSRSGTKVQARTTERRGTGGTVRVQW